MIARAIGPKLTETLGQTFIVDNKAGATGTIGAGAGQARRARRLHLPRHLARPAGDRAAPDQGHAVRRAEGLRPDHGGGAGAQRAGRAGELAAQVAGRRDRLPEGQPGQDDLRLVGQRLERPPDRRAVLAADRHQRRCTCRTRAAAPAITDLLGGQVDASFQNINAGAPAHQGRQAARAGRHRRQALAGAARRADAWPRPASRASRSIRGRRSSRRRACRPTCATSCTRRVVAALNDPAGQAAVHRARLRDRRQHAGAVRRVPAAGVRALEEGDRDRQDHRRLIGRRQRPCPRHPRPSITALRVIPVAGRDSMLLNLSGAHGPFFTRNLLILTDSAGRTGVGEVPGGEKIRQTLEDARALVVGQPLGAHQRAAAARCSSSSPTATRRPRPADLRPAHHDPRGHGDRVGAARPARPAPRRAGRGAARRRPAARRGRDARLPVLRRRPRQDRPALRAASPTPTTTGSACATRRR